MIQAILRFSPEFPIVGHGPCVNWLKSFMANLNLPVEWHC